VCVCVRDNPVAPATAETAAMIDNKGKAALAKKFSFLANKLQAATSTGTLSMVTNQETVQGQLNRYISDLTDTWTLKMQLSSGLSAWAITNSLAHLHLTFCQRHPPPASQVERFFSLCGLMTAGRRYRMETSLQMRAFLKLNKTV